MAFSQKLSAVQTPYPVVTSNYVPGLRLEFARFYRETGHFKLNFSVENSNFSQFFLSGIHIHTFPHNFAKKKFRFIGTLGNNNKKRSHTQLDSRKQVIAFQDRVITINIKEAQHPLK